MISLKKEIQEKCLNSIGRVIGQITIAEKFYKIHKNILKNTKFLNNKNFIVTISERIFCILNNINVIIKCIEFKCTNPVKWNPQKKQYNIYCSTKCSVNSNKTQNKIKNTCLERYGFDNATKCNITRNKIKNTCLERYGTQYSKQKHIPKNVLDKLNDKKWLINEQHNLKKNLIQISNELEYISSPTVGNYFKKHNIEVLCYINEELRKESQNKYKKTCLERYGVENVSQIHIPKDILNKLNDKGWLIKQHHNLKKPLLQIAKELKYISAGTITKYFKKHNIEVLYFLISLQEKQLIEYIKNLYQGEIITNSRNIISPYELDIYLPELNLAFEYNGVYWHQEGVNKSIGYHQMKTNMCQEKGIKLYHIWENDDYKQKVKTIIYKEKNDFIQTISSGENF